MDRQLRDLLEAAAGEPPHRVSAEAVRRRVIRRRAAEFAAAAVAVAAIAAIVPVGLGALGRAHRPPNSGPAAARIFTLPPLRLYRSAPRGLAARQARNTPVEREGRPGYDRRVVDLFAGPHGIAAWTIAAPTNKSLESYTSATIRASRAAHPCSPPQTSQDITIGGAPARLLSMQCPAGSGFLVEIGVTVRHGTAFVFASQNQTGTKPTDQAAFRNFLAGIRLRR